MKSLLVSEEEAKAYHFFLTAAGRTRLLLSSLEVWKSSILSS